MAGLGAVGWIIYAVVIIAMFYFLGVRPQQQEKKKLQDLMSSLAVGDTVLTSSGFYGVILGDSLQNMRFLVALCSRLRGR